MKAGAGVGLVVLACGLAPACGGDGSTSGTTAGQDGSDGADDGAPTGATTGGAGDTGADGSTGAAATDDGTGTGVVAGRPNWYEDIAPLVSANCVACHTEGGVAPFPMDTFELAQPYAPVMALEAEAGAMPPWHAIETDECTPPAPFKHDARLTAEQIQLLRDWTDAGAPQGDPADAVDVPPPADPNLADPTTTVTMGSPITVEPGEALDFFHCLSFDPGHTEEVFVDGIQVIPGNELIAHHTLLYVDESAESAAWPGGVSLNCGGGAGVGGAELVGGWVPGGLPIETPEDVAIRLPVGARMIFNMHYHASVLGPETDDATALALRWSATAPQYISRFDLIGAPGQGTSTTDPFSIAVDATGHQEVIEYTVPELGTADVRIWSVINHMHKVGVDMRTSVRRGGDEDCLVQTPNWDFDWQRLYAYDQPIDEIYRVESGDVIVVRCTYDNSLDNPSVVEALAEVGLDTPQTVTLGEGTLDEMCLAGLGVAIGPG